MAGHCDECNAPIDTARTVRLEGNGIHCEFSLCSLCADAREAGAILQIAESFNLVAARLVVTQ